MFKVASVFSLIYVVWGDLLAPGNPSKEMDNWKGESKSMERKCINLQVELIAL